ncbi:hypothetical protein GCM10027598_47160 [Amycolatopsis oliviviridis]|uniref:Uncharacterized protein n=1 Tax=Amycolatopsis oliviviridis TaxID=1471590 RepID=A0ABQ3MBD0_9PSEU|nr:hypothetical protein GCM10017790_84320 [Amycolatopsis oliviviridis]
MTTAAISPAATAADSTEPGNGTIADFGGTRGLIKIGTCGAGGNVVAVADGGDACACFSS